MKRVKSSINSRVFLLITEKKLNPNSFSVKIGKPAQTTNKIVREINKPSYDYLVAIVSTFRDINSEWLLLGEGEMIKSKSETAVLSSENELFRLNNEIKNLNKIIELLEEKVEGFEPAKKNNEYKKEQISSNDKIIK